MDAVTRLVARRVSDPHTVADLTADVFLAVGDSADGYRPGLGSEAAWLVGIGHSIVRAEYRRSSRQAGPGARIAGRRLLDDDIARLEETRPHPATRSRAHTRPRLRRRTCAGPSADSTACSNASAWRTLTSASANAPRHSYVIVMGAAQADGRKERTP
ncbi:RNA polymerase sigma factor [Streptomyces flavofungini]|uniref:RNA polymerase sigma factor n=1 Tax=Streptomyces flavofungini TaxID=68200 RepID=UPI003F541186